jgi:hypothetical protein
MEHGKKNPWRINNSSTYVGVMEVSKDVVILNYKKQKPPMTSVRDNIINYLLINWQDSFPFLSSPSCRDRRRPKILPASGDDIIDDVKQIAVNNKDDVSIITARAGGYGGGGSIILEMVTENGMSSLRLREGAIFRLNGQPKAVKNGTNIGTDLSLLHLPGVFHFGQLAAHRVPLEERGSEGTNAHKDQSGSPNYQPSSNPYERGFVGTLTLCAGAGLLGFAMKLGYKAFEAPWLTAPAIGLGVIAAVIVVHGLWYACLGTWGLPGVYLL